MFADDIQTLLKNTFSAIKQLVISSLVSFWRLGPHLFKIMKKKNNMMNAIFRDAEPWYRDVCFKRTRADLEMFLEVGNACVPKTHDSTKNGERFWLSFSPKSVIGFKLYVKTPFFNIFVTLYLGKGHIQTIKRHSGSDGVCDGKFIYWCELIRDSHKQQQGVDTRWHRGPIWRVSKHLLQG